jgi:hypothetical protein
MLRKSVVFVVLAALLVPGSVLAAPARQTSGIS